MRDIIRLRPHHVLCIHGFSGKGYSKQFIENLKNAIGKITYDPDNLIRLLPEEDLICAACPNNSSGCTSANKSKLYDKRMLEACSLKAGAVLSWREASKEAERNIFRAEKLIQICGDCQWFSICSGNIKNVK
ncbi:MAG: DUF1284 domain-containing protein [Oscillospiraceae bacterium]|jgi:hypothetical protein